MELVHRFLRAVHVVLLLPAVNVDAGARVEFVTTDLMLDLTLIYNSESAPTRKISILA